MKQKKCQLLAKRLMLKIDKIKKQNNKFLGSLPQERKQGKREKTCEREKGF